MNFDTPEGLLQAGLIASLLRARKGDDVGGLLMNFASNQEHIRSRKQQQEMMQQRMAQEAADRQKREAGEQQRNSALEQLMKQNPQLAPLFQIAPDKAVDRAFPKPQMQFAPNGQAVDMNTIQPGQSFAKPNLPEGMEMGPNGPQPIQGYVDMRAKIAAAGRPQVTTNVMPPREVFKDSMALKKDFDAQPEVKGFKEVQQAWDQISTALADPSAANDLAAATKFMKLLDPGSVVRESELAMAMQASGALDRFMNYANRIKTGQKLTPTQRNEFRSAGEALFNASQKRFGETVGQYEGIAKQYGLDSQFIPKPKQAPKNLQRNTTALVRARDAIKRGADPEAVKQRLMEQGYDASGL